jgi:dUTP pyrophosphatase
MKSLKVKRRNENAQLPAFAEDRTAAFDLKACLPQGTKILTFNPWNKEIDVPIKSSGLQIHPGYRVVVPTGLSFEVDPDHVVKIYSRSENFARHGIMLARGVEIVDRGYTDEVTVTLYNTSDAVITIVHGEVIARAIMEELEYYEFEDIT